MAQTQYNIGGGSPTGNTTINSTADNTQVRINSRSYTQASGNSIGFQSKPSQTVTTTGDVIGGEISPRLQAAIGTGQIKGLHVDIDLKGATGGNITDIKVLEVEMVSDASAGRTVSGDAMCMQFRNALQGVTVTGDVGVFEVQANEGVAWEVFGKFPDDSGIAATTGSPASLPANTGYIRVKVGSTLFKIPLYAN